MNVIRKNLSRVTEVEFWVIASDCYCMKLGCVIYHPVLKLFLSCSVDRKLEPKSNVQFSLIG